MKKTYLTGLTIDSATTLGELMNNVVQYQDPNSYFLLLDIKESMIIDEEYELLRDFRKLEELHGCDIPLPESCLK